MFQSPGPYPDHIPEVVSSLQIYQYNIYLFRIYFQYFRNEILARQFYNRLYAVGRLNGSTNVLKTSPHPLVLSYTIDGNTHTTDYLLLT